MRRKRQTETETPATPPVEPMMKVSERREYITRMPQQGEAQASGPQTITIPARDVPEEEQGDDLLDFLTELEEEIGLSLRVDRLPQYSANGKWHKGATFEFCDNIPINKGDLKSGAYMSTIRDLFGPAAYRCTLREVGAGIIKSWPIKIAAPIAQPQQRQGTSSVIYQTQAAEPQAQRDTLKELIESAKQMNELKKLFGWEHESQAPMPVAQVTVEKEPLTERIIGAALEAALKSERPETMAEILRGYLNPGKDEFSWKEIISEIVKPMAPIFMGILAQYMQRQAAQQVPQVNVGQIAQGQLPPLQPGPPLPQQPTGFPLPIEIPQNGPVTDNPIFPIMPDLPQDTDTGITFSTGPASPWQQPQQIASDEPLSPEEEEEMARDDLIYNLGMMLEECVRKAASDPVVIEQGRAEVMAYKRRFPLMTSLIDALATLPPEAIIGMLAAKVPEVASMINNGTAQQAIVDFQAALKRPE